jgi:hypothetical protein
MSGKSGEWSALFYFDDHVGVSAGDSGAGREGKEKEWKSRFADPVSFEQYPLGSRLIVIPACDL